MSIFTSKKVWNFLMQIHLTKSNPRITRELKVPCLMPIRVKQDLFFTNCHQTFLISSMHGLYLKNRCLTLKNIIRFPLREFLKNCTLDLNFNASADRAMAYRYIRHLQKIVNSDRIVALPHCTAGLCRKFNLWELQYV